MPSIVIKDYTWRQTAEFVILKVPLRGRPKKVDLFVIDNYMKVSFPPFILELFLWANVIEKESRCTITDQEAIAVMRKVNIDLEWPTLELKNIDNGFKHECRNRAIENARKLAEEATNAEREKRQHLQKEAVREQISINTATLNKIDAIRDIHRKEAMREFEDWRSKTEIPFLPNAKGEVQKNAKAYKPPLKWFQDADDKLKSRPMIEEEIFSSVIPTTEFECNRKKNEEMVYNKETTKINVVDEIKEINPKTQVSAVINHFSGDVNDSSSSEDSESDNEFQFCNSIHKINTNNVTKFDQKKRMKRSGLEAIEAAMNGNFLKRNNIFEDPWKSVPLPRKMATINVTFSERKFPTPARESSHLEEQEWLQKQAEARRKIGFNSEDLRQEERDPQWLKEKGDEFFKVGNYLAAISAYSYGIKISDKMASLYVNRSAAHYAVQNYYRCIDDCSKAIELMELKCEGNRKSRARCHARRGAALCKLSAPQHGIPELEAALKLTPDNESIKRDVVAAKQYFDIKD